MNTYPNTPAPWSIGSNGASVKVTDADGKAVCMLTPRKGAWNGDLIAAAPDMLDALLLALPYVEDVLDNPEQLACFKAGVVQSHAKAIRAAIAKATGETL